MNVKKTSLIALSVIASLTLSLGLFRAGGRRDVPPAPGATAPLRAEGRVAAYPGGDVTVGSEQGGTVERVLVNEGDSVKAGQLLALLDARQPGAALREARSREAELDEEVRFLDQEARRSAALHEEGIASRQALDQARNQLELARARRQAARATAERLEVALGKHRILSPLDGVVLSRWVQPGETLAPGARVVQVADTGRLRIEAEIDEFDFARIRTGTPAEVRAEGSPETWKGVVEEVPAQVVGRRLKPQDPARPSDTRVLLAKVGLREPAPLKLGQRVELQFNLR